MPGRIIALYTLLGLRVLTSGAGLVKVIPATTLDAEIALMIAALEFSASLFILLSLYHKKKWVITAFRIYMMIALPVSLFLMWFASSAAAQRGEAFAWNKFYGGVIGALLFGWFAWYVGGGKTREFLSGTTLADAKHTSDSSADNIS